MATPLPLYLCVTICVGARVWCVHSRQCELTMAVFISPGSMSLSVDVLSQDWMFLLKLHHTSHNKKLHYAPTVHNVCS